MAYREKDDHMKCLCMNPGIRNKSKHIDLLGAPLQTESKTLSIVEVTSIIQRLPYPPQRNYPPTSTSDVTF
jgi:hypothetical protein